MWFLKIVLFVSMIGIDGTAQPPKTETYLIEQLDLHSCSRVISETGRSEVHDLRSANSWPASRVLSSDLSCVLGGGPYGPPDIEVNSSNSDRTLRS